MASTPLPSASQTLARAHASGVEGKRQARASAVSAVRAAADLLEGDELAAFRADVAAAHTTPKAADQ